MVCQAETCRLFIYNKLLCMTVCVYVYIFYEQAQRGLITLRIKS